MSNGRASLERRLAVISAAFADKLEARLGEMEAHLRSIARDGGDAPQALRRLRDQAHKLAGAGATFGFADLGRDAGALEVLCESVLDRADGPSRGDMEEIKGLVERIKSAAGSPNGA